MATPDVEALSESLTNLQLALDAAVMTVVVVVVGGVVGGVGVTGVTGVAGEVVAVAAAVALLVSPPPPQPAISAIASSPVVVIEARNSLLQLTFRGTEGAAEQMWGFMSLL